MTQRHIDEPGVNQSSQGFIEGFRALSNEILEHASRSVQRVDFLRIVSKMLLEYSDCDAVEIRLEEGNRSFTSEVRREDSSFFRFEAAASKQGDSKKSTILQKDNIGLEDLCTLVLRGGFSRSSNFVTDNGSFWTGNAHQNLHLSSEIGRQTRPLDVCIGGDYPSLALIPLKLGEGRIGLLLLKSKQYDSFTKEKIEFYEGVGQTLGFALAHRRSNALLRERVKELSCLYNIAQVAAQAELPLEKALQKIVEVLPLAWLYPEVASARIILDGTSYTAPNFGAAVQKLTADIIIGGDRRGTVEVTYAQEKPEIDEGPFLREERKLIETIAKEITAITERKQVEEDRAKLEEQLRHADRLATVGQLAAGVAHELNEPLGAILGFAQLSLRSVEMPHQIKEDIGKIVTAALHAREVVKKLLIFARQVPAQKRKVNLNQIVEDGLYFLSSRCAKEGIELSCSLASDLPDIIADSSQLQQVLVNLVVNAIQAMPNGGRLTIRTAASDSFVSLIVEDTGIGMSEEILKEIFIPFFTTKPLGQGTGLGLPVVHGIVTSHGGSITVNSKVGEGTRFEVLLPVAQEKREEMTGDE